jgi:hypothetical protein
MESTTCGGSEKQGWSGNEVIIDAIVHRLFNLTPAEVAARAIPTRVGKSLAFGPRREPRTGHPHARGEIQSFAHRRR